MPALQRGAAWPEGRLFGALRQSVPQNGRVHLHIIDNFVSEGMPVLKCVFGCQKIVTFGKKLLKILWASL